MSTMASQITSLTIVYSTVYSKKTSKLRDTGLCETGEFPARRASNAENVSIWWSHHASFNDGFAKLSLKAWRSDQCSVQDHSALGMS